MKQPRYRLSSRWFSASLRLLSLSLVFVYACGRDSKSGAGRAPGDALVQALQSVSKSGSGLPGPPPTTEDRAQLLSLYQSSGYTPLWLGGSGKLRGVGKDALDHLLHAEAEGLRPDDYAAAELDSLARQMPRQSAGTRRSSPGWTRGSRSARCTTFATST